MTRQHNRRVRSKHIRGVSGFSNPIYAQTASPGGFAGQSGCYVALVCRPTALGNGNYWLTRLGASAGWGILQNGASTVCFRAANGSGTLVSSPSYTATANTLLAVVGVHDGSNLRLYVNGAEVGSGTAITGYTAHSNRTYIGAAGSASAFLDFFGAYCGNSVPSADQISAWYLALRSANRVIDVPGQSATVAWLPSSSATIINEIGAQTLTVTGGTVTLARAAW